MENCDENLPNLSFSVLIEGIKFYANNPSMIGKTFLRLERDFDKHVNYCRDESNAQEYLFNNDAVREFFEVSKERNGRIEARDFSKKLSKIFISCHLLKNKRRKIIEKFHDDNLFDCFSLRLLPHDHARVFLI